MENKYSSTPFISCNIKNRDSGDLLFKPYVTLNRNGLNLGVIGLSNMIPDTMTSVKTEDYISAGNKYIKEINAPAATKSSYAKYKDMKYKDVLDKRKGYTTIFQYCPNCGKKVNWKAIKQEIDNLG